MISVCLTFAVEMYVYDYTRISHYTCNLSVQIIIINVFRWITNLHERYLNQMATIQYVKDLQSTIQLNTYQLQNRFCQPNV